MSDDPPSRLPPATSPGPEGGERRRLDRAPGARYEPGGTAATGGPGGAAVAIDARRRRTRTIIAAVVVADACAALFFALGLLDLGAGLLAIAAFTGWAVALALVWWGRDAIADGRTRVAMAVFLAGWAIVAAMTVDWLYALAQGGVLGPLDYVAQRYGIVAPLAILVATAVAGLRAR